MSAVLDDDMIEVAGSDCVNCRKLEDKLETAYLKITMLEEGIGNIRLARARVQAIEHQVDDALDMRGGFMNVVTRRGPIGKYIDPVEVEALYNKLGSVVRVARELKVRVSRVARIVNPLKPPRLVQVKNQNGASARADEVLRRMK